MQIGSEKDFDELIDEFKGLQHYDLLQMTGENHLQQSCFDKSDFRPFMPLTASFYVTKFV